MKKDKIQEEQVFYNDRWVDKTHFRAFVYNKDSQKLCNSYEEYEKAISSGLWFSDKEKVDSSNVEKISKARKPKDGAIS